MYLMEMNPAKTAELTEMSFGTWARAGSSNHVLDRGLDPPGEMAILGMCIHGHEHSRYIQQDDVAFYRIPSSLVNQHTAWLK